MPSRCARQQPPCDAQRNRDRNRLRCRRQALRQPICYPRAEAHHSMTFASIYTSSDTVLLTWIISCTITLRRPWMRSALGIHVVTLFPEQSGASKLATHLTLLCLSRARWKVHRPGELPVELAGDVSLDAAADFPGGLSFGGAPGDVGAGSGAAADPADGDGVDGAVEGAVAAAVEPVPDGSAAAGRDRAGAGQGG